MGVLKEWFRKMRHKMLPVQAGKGAAAGKPVRAGAAAHTVRIVVLLAAALAMGAALLILPAGAYQEEVLVDYFQFWQIPLLNAFPVVVLALLMYGVTGRVWSAFALSGGAALALSLVNFYKLVFRNEPLYFENLLLFREAANMVVDGEYKPFVNDEIIILLLFLLIVTVILFYFCSGKVLSWKGRIVLVLVSLAVSATSFSVYTDGILYDSIQNYSHLNMFHPADIYTSKGFIYPFLHSVNDVWEASIPGYSETGAKNLLNSYTDADIPDDRKINIIMIMREAYADFSRYDILGLDNSVYDDYHALESESYTGDLLTNVFAGGTVMTERGVLTGNYRLRNFRSNVNSYVWYLREQGFTAEGGHPYYSWFYDRRAINLFLGFENYRFYENDYENLSDFYYPEDFVLLPEIYNDFQKKKEKPYFSFSVTMQSHGPYPTDYVSQKEYLSADYSEECRGAMNFYLSITESMDKALYELADRLRGDSEPVVLVTFGDHLPWMGDGNAFYDEMGVDIDAGTEEGYLRHYSTRYLIWANDAAKDILGHDVRGEGPTISPCFLINVLFRQLGWEGPAFLQAMDDIMEVFPVVTTNGYYVVDGNLTSAMPEERKQLYQEFLYLQYYWRNQFLFG